MVRIIGVDLPKSKRVIYALTYIHGIGLTSAKKFVQEAEINSQTRVYELTRSKRSDSDKYWKIVI